MLKKAQCLIIACGNTLRSDDGIGPWLATWAEERFREDPTVRVLARQQWTPELAEDLAQAESVLFIDCSIESAPGSIHLRTVEPSAPQQGLATHHSGAPELLALAGDLFDSQPENAQLLTIGAGSIELGEEFSPTVTAALPKACNQIESTMHAWLQ